MKVPDVLVSGNHKEIKIWRDKKMMERTFDKRFDKISDDYFKNYSNSNGVRKHQENSIKLQIENQYEIYPDW